jgi:hypothetical protein
VSIEATKTNWDIRAEGRAWADGEAMDRYFSAPHKIEMVNGKLLDRVEDREHLLCLLLENVGAARVVQFGDPRVWREAAALLKV